MQAMTTAILKQVLVTLVRRSLNSTGVWLERFSTLSGDALRANQAGAADHDDFHSYLRRTAYATAIITFASHEANAPILTPDIPAMIAAATMALSATQTRQRRSAVR